MASAPSNISRRAVMKCSVRSDTAVESSSVRPFSSLSRFCGLRELSVLCFVLFLRACDLCDCGPSV